MKNDGVEGDKTMKHVIAESLLEINAVALKPKDPFYMDIRAPVTNLL